MRELDFDDGFESSAAPVVTVSTITGTSSAPTAITAGGGITAAAVPEETQFVSGTGGVDINANPQISAGTFDGQKLTLIGTSDTDYVLLENGNGLQLNGPCTLTNAAEIGLMWNAAAAVWRERYRNGMA